MTQATNSTRKGSTAKGRNRQGLWKHSSGNWAKRINGKVYYFGPNKREAMARYKAERATLETGGIPPERADNLRLRELCDSFLTMKESKVRTAVGEPGISGDHFNDLHSACRVVVRHFGEDRSVESLRVADFAGLLETIKAKGNAPSSDKRLVTNIRSVFKWAYESESVDKPVRMGDFIGATKRELDRAKVAKLREVDPTYAASEIQNLVSESTSPHLKALILLGINAAMGNRDLAYLPQCDLNLETGWMRTPRNKTYQPRAMKLWPETIEALELSLSKRPAGKGQYAELVFVTKYGNPWVTEHPKKNDAISKGFAKLEKKAGTKQHKRSFYNLRHTFSTVASEANDQKAVDYAMGHSDSSMAANYNHSGFRKRIESISDHVRQWYLEGSDVKPSDF